MDINIIKLKQGKYGKTEIIPYSPLSSSYADNAGADIKYLNISYIKTLINAAGSQFYKMVYLFLFETAARIGEARGIKFSDIDLATNKIRLITLKQRNAGNIFRVLKISDTLKALILQHRIENKLLETDYIFSKITNSKPITKQAVDKNLKKDIKLILGDSSMDKAHPHMFRHSRAINLLDAGMNIVKLKDFLGHKNIQNTLIYLRYSNADILKEIDNANKMNGLD